MKSNTSPSAPLNLCAPVGVTGTTLPVSPVRDAPISLPVHPVSSHLDSLPGFDGFERVTYQTLTKAQALVVLPKMRILEPLPKKGNAIIANTPGGEFPLVRVTLTPGRSTDGKSPLYALEFFRRVPASPVKDTPAETEDEHTGATAVNGDEWTGERDGEWWNYRAKDGSIYESREVPVYRIKMDNAKQVLVDGKLSIAPASPVASVGVLKVGDRVQLVEPHKDRRFARVKAIHDGGVKISEKLGGFLTWNAGDLQAVPYEFSSPLRLTLDPGKGPLLKMGHLVVARFPRCLGVPDELNGNVKGVDEMWDLAEEILARCNAHASHAAKDAKIKALEEACNLLIREMQFTGKIREDFSRRVAVEAGKKALALPSA